MRGPSARGWVALSLIAATLAVYAQVLANGFLIFDDPGLITDNPHVRAGLSWETVRWAFASAEESNWFPLTRLSLALDCQLFGLSAGWHHAAGAMLHALNVVILLLALTRMTGELWRSAFVAAVFALHPLQVESVAWAAERSTLLAGLFWLAALLAYIRYARRPGPMTYLPLALLFALGALSKPTVVTLPVVLLLLDYWPLRRWTFSPLPPDSAGPVIARAPARILLLEKLPLLAVSAASSAITLVAQRHDSIVSLGHIAFRFRLENALVAYAKYLGKTLWPSDLAVFYPYPERGMPVWETALAGAVLAGVTLLAGRSVRRRPYLAVGWSWFLGILVPTIGLVQVGAQAMADRYMYLPIIGLALLVAWGAPDLARARPALRPWLPLAGGAALLALAGLTWQRLPLWKDSRTLFENAIRVTGESALAENNLGVALANAGRWDEATAHYEEALRIQPNNAMANYNLANVLARRGDAPRAARLYEAAIGAQPDCAEAHYELGVVLVSLGDRARAETQYREALRIRPDLPDARNNLGILLAHRGRLDEAATQFSEALRSHPASAVTHANLANALAGQGKLAEARAHYQEALRLDPDLANARAGLAWVREREAAGARSDR